MMPLATAMLIGMDGSAGSSGQQPIGGRTFQSVRSLVQLWEHTCQKHLMLGRLVVMLAQVLVGCMNTDALPRGCCVYCCHGYGWVGFYFKLCKKTKVMD